MSAQDIRQFLKIYRMKNEKMAIYIASLASNAFAYVPLHLDGEDEVNEQVSKQLTAIVNLQLYDHLKEVMTALRGIITGTILPMSSEEKMKPIYDALDLVDAEMCIEEIRVDEAMDVDSAEEMHKVAQAWLDNAKIFDQKIGRTRLACISFEAGVSHGRHLERVTTTDDTEQLAEGAPENRF